MIRAIRLATPEEIERIKAESDLTFTSTVFAFETDSGVTFAVVRQCWEVDPIISEGKDDARRKALLMFGLETGFNMLGISEYYFNIDPADETWKSALQHWGAEQVSKEPQLRFKKQLKRLPNGNQENNNANKSV